MSYLILPNLASAMAQSAAYWNTTLGRAKNANDVTTYLLPWLVGLDGTVALDTKYNPKNIIFAGVVATLNPVNWPPPIAPQLPA